MFEKRTSHTLAVRAGVDEQHLQVLPRCARETHRLTIDLGDGEANVREVGIGQSALDVRAVGFGQKVMCRLDRAAPDRHQLRVFGWAGAITNPHRGQITDREPRQVDTLEPMDAIDEAGPFFHGTKAHLAVGDLLTAGFRSNYRPEIVMNHIYFTALLGGAGLAAELAAGDGEPRVYRVEPTGDFENDPNVTDKKFPGNPTRSYRSSEALRVVEEILDWPRLTPEALQEWRDRLAALRADGLDEIIN